MTVLNKYHSNKLFTSKKNIALYGLVILCIIVPLFISLGIWQWNKAQRKQLSQAKIEQYSQQTSNFSLFQVKDLADWQYRHVSLSGEFEATWQIYIDNRVYQEQAGYHVLTPLRLINSDTRVWINRGWIAKADLAKATIPSGLVNLHGTIQIPAKKYFSLENSSEKDKWKAIWQQPDLLAINKHLPWSIYPLQIELDKNADAGFTRDWAKQDTQVSKHLSYAMQWFGFALSSIIIWLFFLLRKSDVK